MRARSSEREVDKVRGFGGDKGQGDGELGSKVREGEAGGSKVRGVEHEARCSVVLCWLTPPTTLAAHVSYPAGPRCPPQVRPSQGRHQEELRGS